MSCDRETSVVITRHVLWCRDMHCDHKTCPAIIRQIYTTSSLNKWGHKRGTVERKFKWLRLAADPSKSLRALSNIQILILRWDSRFWLWLEWSASPPAPESRCSLVSNEAAKKVEKGGAVKQQRRWSSKAHFARPHRSLVRPPTPCCSTKRKSNRSSKSDANRKKQKRIL